MAETANALEMSFEQCWEYLRNRSLHDPVLYTLLMTCQHPDRSLTVIRMLLAITDQMAVEHKTKVEAAQNMLSLDNRTDFA
jgi:hypothetical protein